MTTQTLTINNRTITKGCALTAFDHSAEKATFVVASVRKMSPVLWRVTGHDVANNKISLNIWECDGYTGKGIVHGGVHIDNIYGSANIVANRVA